MKIATYQDKELVISILSRSFKDNKSVNHLLPQDDKLPSRIKALMDYSFEICMASGQVLICDNAKACALLKISGKPSRALLQFWLDLKLLWSAIGFGSLPKALKHENTLSRIRGKSKMSYLWFIGVQPEYQHLGKGTQLLKEVLAYCKSMDAPVYLETSATINLPWYQKHGFAIYHTLEGEYQLFFLRHTF